MTDIPNARAKFFILRSEAIDAYANLEKGLSLLFARSLRTKQKYGTLIVSRIVNTRARNQIIQAVIDDVTNEQLKTFTNSLFKLIGEADSARNHVVHWHVVQKNSGEIVLKTPDVFRGYPFEDSGEEVDDRGLSDFRWKSLFLTAAISLLQTYVSASEARASLPDIFQRPLSYPPAPDHPLFEMSMGPEAPPWSISGVISLVS
jgi:hypothetical protein